MNGDIDAMEGLDGGDELSGVEGMAGVVGLDGWGVCKQIRHMTGGA